MINLTNTQVHIILIPTRTPANISTDKSGEVLMILIKNKTVTKLIAIVMFAIFLFILISKILV